MHKVLGDTVTIREYQECGYHSKQLKEYSMRQNHEHIKALLVYSVSRNSLSLRLGLITLPLSTVTFGTLPLSTGTLPLTPINFCIVCTINTQVSTSLCRNSGDAHSV